MVAYRNQLCPIMTHGLVVWPAFNFQWAWSSGTVAGESADRER